MSLGDHLRYLRALHNVEPDELMTAVGEAYRLQYWQVERKYTDISEDGLVERLAAFYRLPRGELEWHRQRTRKALSVHVGEAIQEGQAVKLKLRSGEWLIGRPVWCDLGAIGLETRSGDPLTIVQRHAVIDWVGAPG